MNLVIEKLVEVLSSSPEAVLPTNQLGSKRPSGASEVPSIAISLSLETGKFTGIGRVIRSGDGIVETTNVIEVKTPSETFSSDLKSLRLEPLPLKKNPASTEQRFTRADVQVRNVTDPVHPVDYMMADRPTKKTEYRLDVPQAQIVFGLAQTEGERLEVDHWTVTWRDEILGNRYRGSAVLEIWAGSLNQANEISGKLQQKLRSSRGTLRQKGFLQLQPASLEPVENVLHDPPSGSPFPVWKQKLGYRFVFESEQGGELSSGIPIKRIGVDMDEHLVESFSISK